MVARGLSVTRFLVPGFLGAVLLLVSSGVLGSAPSRATYAVSVTPDGGEDPTRDPNTSGWTTVFNVRNTGTQAANFTLACSGYGGVTCTGLSQVKTGTLNPSQSVDVTATYSVGTEQGVVELEAFGSGAGDVGDVSVYLPPSITLVTPAVTSADTALVHTRRPLIIATYVANGGAIDSATLFVKLGSDTVSNTSLVRWNGGLMEFEVDASRELTPGTSRDLVIRICNDSDGCTTRTTRLLLDNSGTPIVSFAGMPLEAQGRHFSAPFGPGLSVNGAEVETGFSAPPYYRFGSPRTVGLVYSTRQSYPRALVNADIELTWPAGTPDSITAFLFDGATKKDSLRLSSPSCTSSGGGRRCRVTLQGDFSGSTWSGAQRKWLKVEVRVRSGGTVKTTTDSVEVVLVDRRTSRFGNGWYVSNLTRIYTAGNDAILVDGSGASSVYRGTGSAFISPPGDFSTLVKNGNGTWQLRFRGGGNLNFDTYGRATQLMDRHAQQQMDWSYQGTGDSVGRIGNFYFKYQSGYTEIRDSVSGTGTRVTTYYINSGRLDSLRLPGSGSYDARYTYNTSYGSNSAVLLASRTDALGSATSVSYDTTRARPTQATLPAVLTESGGSTSNPVIQYRAQELRGLDTLILGDSAYVRVVDPLGNWTRSALNRWGAAERTWDALGTLGRASYTPEGFVAWSEGIVADSTRVYSTYDRFGRRIRSYRLRSVGDPVLLDSLIYDASHRVIKRINALGQRDSMVYNSYGDVIRSYTPTNDVTYFSWNSNGTLYSVRAPGQTDSTRYTYTSLNMVYEVIPAGAPKATTNTYDVFGRLTDARRRVAVRADSATGPYYRWTRTISAYTALNQVDSVRREFSAECQPCTSGPAEWPDSIQDSLQWQHVRHLYDRLGRDTLRLNTRDKGTRYLYDALGRLLARYPFAESTAVRDSFRYDIGGRLRYQWTRRAVQISHYYDSRNRDTLTTVPGVGDYRRTYAGPNGELTRDSLAWCAGCDSLRTTGDPVVNASVDWGYSQAGLLLADTSQGNRVTTYLYDRYGRDTSSADVRGTTRLRYHGTLGALDTIVAPYGDSLTYTIDARGRMIGPVIRNGSDPDVTANQTFNQYGKLLTLTETHVVQVGAWDDDPDFDEPLLHFRPTWTEQRGSGGATVSMADSLVHDGWGRLTRAVALRNDSVKVTQEFAFGRDGNIKVGALSYDVTTTRLLSHEGALIGYDRAGNMVSYGTNGWTYSYDPLDRLIAVRHNGTPIARYAYDVLGRRIAARIYSAGPLNATVEFRRMIYRGGAVIAEADSGGTLTLGYTWGPGVDNLVAVHKYGTGSGDWYVVQDQIRSVRGLTKRDGTWVASWRYDVYGAGSDSAGTPPFALRYGWTTREFDRETGFFFLRARFYHPSFRRFVQEDPIGYSGDANLYAYGDGNPTNGRDPSGLMMEYQDLSYRVTKHNFGRGIIDWNGDGWDDFDEFTEYSWGRQLWLRAGGSSEGWQAIWYDAIMPQSPGIRETLVELTFWGDIRTKPMPGDTTTIATTCGRTGSDCGAGPNRPLTIYYNPNILLSQSRHELASNILHELYHLTLRYRGYEYGEFYSRGGPVDPETGINFALVMGKLQEQRAASCFAYRQYGWVGSCW